MGTFLPIFLDVFTNLGTFRLEGGLTLGRFDHSPKFQCKLGPSITGLVTYIQVCTYWKYAVVAELSKLAYIED